MSNDLKPAVSWKDIVSTLSYQRNPNMAMLTNDGYVTAIGKGNSYKLVQYDRNYVINFIRNKVVIPLDSLDLNSLQELLNEAYIGARANQ
jgi:hypothetical protein